MEAAKVEDDPCRERPWMQEENAKENGCPNAYLTGERERVWMRQRKKTRRRRNTLLVRLRWLWW